MATKKEELDPYMIEYAMNHWFSIVKTRRQRKYAYSQHRVNSFLRAGYLAPDREVQHETWTEIYYKPTPEGLKWWVEQRAVSPEKADVASLSQLFEGKGIGAEVAVNTLSIAAFGHGRSVFNGIRDGLFGFISHMDYSGFPRSGNEYVTVSLTEKGMRFFDSLPKFVEVWE